MIIVGGVLACDDVEVADDSGAAQVEQVLAGAAVAGAAALPMSDVGQGVLDLDPLAELGSPGRGGLTLAQLGQQRASPEVDSLNHKITTAASGAVCPLRARSDSQRAAIAVTPGTNATAATCVIGGPARSSPTLPS
jgi:hypothetical protein